MRTLRARFAVLVSIALATPLRAQPGREPPPRPSTFGRSSNITMAPSEVPAAPASLTAKATAKGVELSWSLVPTAAEYRIFRGPSGSDAKPIGVIPAENFGGLERGTFVDRGHNDAADYRVVVKGLNRRLGPEAKVTFAPKAK